MTITLRDITRDNWRACTKLKVADGQERFVATNAYSLAQARYEPECLPLAIYDDETMVGFLMYREADYGLAKVWYIDRLLIGAEFQRRGYGRAGMLALIERLRAIPGYAAVLISFVPDNDAARDLYASLGFTDTGEIDYGEIVYRLPLHPVRKRGKA
ncbi:MAG: GNAT family N-acetyltransferase [Anaerolineae bacterium]|nr:GNAT family N-acetyltransferase [Anaerolineae bacterium]